MKRIFPLFLAGTLLLSLAACGSAPAESDPPSSTASTSQEEPILRKLRPLLIFQGMKPQTRLPEAIF